MAETSHKLWKQLKLVLISHSGGFVVDVCLPLGKGKQGNHNVNKALRIYKRKIHSPLFARLPHTHTCTVWTREKKVKQDSLLLRRLKKMLHPVYNSSVFRRNSSIFFCTAQGKKSLMRKVLPAQAKSRVRRKRRQRRLVPGTFSPQRNERDRIVSVCISLESVQQTWWVSGSLPPQVSGISF